ncbi:glycosyltransferase family 4 protein [Leptolyngbya sp. BC1307]|uniref:glycosyltransferase family 4 protein n=1 Tax=Leptolyngbya sp. BC1307 TaxID=2029589 RepID=UPI000EFD9269|nr:glycosyltransferase family 4 protein [Leptolyngbya sp. BC1307]
MTRIIHINDKVHNAGGVEVYLSSLQPLLEASGWQSRWIGIRRNGKRICVADAKFPEREVCDNLRNLGKILREEKDGQPVIFHVHSLSDPVLLDFLFSQGPVVRTIHEPRIFCPGQGKFWRTDETPCLLPCGLHCIWHAYQKRCCNRHPKRLSAALRNTFYERKTAANRYAALIANSHWTASQAMEAGFPEQKIQTIPYFTSVIKPSPPPENSTPIVLFVGRLTREKGLHHLLDALKITCDLGIDSRLEIVGDGHEREFFEQYAQELGLNNHCKFYGWLCRDEIQRCFHSCSIVAFPSVYPEAFGIVGIEAMMHERPVVAFDVGGVREWLEDGVTGSIVPAKDSARLAAALGKLCTDSEYAAQMGKAGRAIALKQFSPKHHLSALTDLYRRISSLAIY